MAAVASPLREGMGSYSPLSRRVVLRMTVDIAPGRVETIDLMEGDSAAYSAEVFCQQHALSTKLVGPLTTYIQDNLAKVEHRERTTQRRSMHQPSTRSSHSQFHSSLAPAAVVPTALGSGRGAAHVPDGRENVPPSHHMAAVTSAAASKREGAAEFVPPPSSVAPNRAYQFSRSRASSPASSIRTSSHSLASSVRTSSTLGASARNHQQPQQQPQQGVVAAAQPAPRARPHSAPRQRPSSSSAASTHVRQQATYGGQQRPAVHERLYEGALLAKEKLEAERRQRERELTAAAKSDKVVMSQVSQQLMKHRTKGAFESYGELLYVEGMERRSELERLQREREAEREAEELKELTLRPSVSEGTKRMMPKNPVPLWERLQDANDEKQAKLQAEREAKAAQELAQCSFKPNINSRSKELMKDRATIMREYKKTAHELLFLDAERRRERREEYETYVPQDATFQPNSSSMFNSDGNSNQSSASASYSLYSDGKPAEDVVERMRRADTQRESRVEELRHVREQYSPSTGAPLWKPKVGRAPQRKRNDAALPIGDFLYSIRNEFTDKKEYLADRARLEVAKDAAMAKTNFRSEAMASKLKSRRMQQLFARLDTEKRGKICLDEVLERADLEAALRSDLEYCLELTGPLAITYEQFEEALQRVLDTVKAGPRQYMYEAKASAGEATAEAEEAEPLPTFQPHVNRNAGELAARRRGSHVSIYDAHMADRAHTQWKVEEIKRQKEQAELALCTFQPQTYLAGPFISKNHKQHKKKSAKPTLTKAPQAKKQTHAVRELHSGRCEAPAEADEQPPQQHEASAGSVAEEMASSEMTMPNEAADVATPLRAHGEDSSAVCPQKGAVSDARVQALEQELQSVLGLSGKEWAELNASIERRSRTVARTGKAGTADFLAGASAELDAAFSKIEKSFLVNHGHAQPTPPPASKQQSISMKMDPLMDPTHLLFDQEEQSPVDHTRYAAAKARLQQSR